MKKTIFTGMATAIVTPMTADGIDYEALGRFIEFQIENGINAIVVMEKKSRVCSSLQL